MKIKAIIASGAYVKLLKFLRQTVSNVTTQKFVQNFVYPSFLLILFP